MVVVVVVSIYINWWCIYQPGDGEVVMKNDEDDDCRGSVRFGSVGRSVCLGIYLEIWK